jgi:hypothetical protein
MLHFRYYNVMLICFHNHVTYLQTHIIESDEARSVLEGRLQVSFVELKQVRTFSCSNSSHFCFAQVQLALGAEQLRLAGLQAALLVESDGESEAARSGGEDSSLEQVNKEITFISKVVIV